MHHYVLACVLCLVARTALGEPAATEPRKVVIIDGINFKTEGLRTTVREADHFYDVVVQRLKDKGWSPMTPPIAQALCGGAGAGGDCLAYVVRESGAAYVLRLTGEGNLREGYSLHLEVYSSKTKHSQKSSHVCDVCLTDDIARSAAEVSLGLLADAVKDDADTKREIEQQAASANATETRALKTAPPVSEPRHLSWIPWSMVGVGVIGVALGAWWLHEDGQSKGFQATSPVISNDYYSSQSVGITSLVGGLALLAGGAVWLALTPSSTVSVSASPSHVALGLRY